MYLMKSLDNEECLGTKTPGSAHKAAMRQKRSRQNKGNNGLAILFFRLDEMILIKTKLKNGRGSRSNIKVNGKAGTLL